VFTVWLLCSLCVVSISLIVTGLAFIKHKGAEWLSALGSVLLIVALGISVLITISQHTTCLSIPFKIAALERTIEQQTALISDDATLGQGLEGLEIKREIQNTIRDLNDLIAKAEYITISPWWMFKPQTMNEHGGG